MRVVGPCVSGTSQVNHGSCNGLECRVGWPAATMAVSDGGNALLSISRQDAPGVASGDTHERRCLVQGHVLSEQSTVQNLRVLPVLFESMSHSPYRRAGPTPLGGAVHFLRETVSRRSPCRGSGQLTALGRSAASTPRLSSPPVVMDVRFSITIRTAQKPTEPDRERFPMQTGRRSPTGSDGAAV